MLRQPGGTETHRVSHTLTVSSPMSSVFTALTSRAGIDALLDETVRFDARQGGKLRFISQGDDGYGGTYSMIRVAKRVIILTEIHGELDFRLSDKGAITEVTVKASRLSTPEGKSDWESRVASLMGQLGDVVKEVG
jgi:uncharacterized protein YndB with AHSA1/START domain